MHTRSARYEEAIGHFQKATELDPNLPMAKTYLATALSQNIVPGLTTPENMKTAEPGDLDRSRMYFQRTRTTSTA